MRSARRSSGARIDTRSFVHVARGPASQGLTTTPVPSLEETASDIGLSPVGKGYAERESGRRALRKPTQQLEGWAGADVLRAHEVLRSHRGDLPCFGRGEAELEVAETAVDGGIRPLALDEVRGPSALDHDEVDLATVHVAPLGILKEVHPLEQVCAHEVLEALGLSGNDRPVEVIVLRVFSSLVKNTREYFPPDVRRPAAEPIQSRPRRPRLKSVET